MRFLLLLFSLTFIISTPAEKWGKNGHRAVGDIAAEYLTEEAREGVNELLGHESMAMASTWMDEIRSDSNYDHTHDWHWVTIPDGMTYEETEKNPNGDIIEAIRRMIDTLKNDDAEKQEQVEALKMLIHLVGDIHQPLHVGTGEDQGGNDVDLNWFRESTNLHRVWDSNMIDEHQLSYTELAESINHPTEKEIEQWQNDDVLDWARDSMELRDQVYDLPDHGNISYEYMYHNFETVERQLLKAGIRLAGVLNEVYSQ